MALAQIMRFILLGEDRMSRANDSAARSTDRLSKKVDQNNKLLEAHKKATKQAGVSLGLLAGHVTGAGDAFTICNRKASMFARVMGGIGLATGLAEPLVSSLVVAVGGLSSALVVAGAGAGAYGVALKPVLTQVGSLMKLQQQAAKGSKAAQQQYQQAIKHTNPAILSFTKELTASQKTYHKWADSLARPVLAPLRSALSVVKPLLHAITPLVKVAAGAFKTLVGQLATRIKGGGVDYVVSILLPKVRPILLSLGHSIGNIIGGLWGIVKAFLPFSTTVTGGLEKLTKKFDDWANTLSGHSGFHAIVAQWRQDWPQIQPVLKNLLTFLKNIISDLAGMTTPANSKALWMIANPLMALATKLSEHPALITALTYLVLIGKTGSRIKGVFDSLKTGWGTFSALVAKLSGGKINLGMQSAGDTMLIASENMQKAANTMAAASGVAGAGGGAVGGAEAAAGAAGAGGFLGKLRSMTGLKWIVRGGIALAVGDLVLRTAIDLVPKQQGAVPKGAGWARRISEAILGRGVDNVAIWWDKHISQPIRDSAKRDFAWLAGRSGAAAGSLAKPLNDLTEKSKALARAGNPIANMFDRQTGSAKAADKALGNYTRSIYNNGLRSEQTKKSRQTLLNDMINAGVKADTAKRDVGKYTDAIRHNGYGSDEARAARQRLITDIENAFKNSQQGKRDIKNYTDALRINGEKTQVARDARKKLITDLVNSGLSAKDAKKLVQNLTTAIDNMHGKKVTVSVLGKGSGLLSYKLAVPHEMTSKGTLEFHAAGGLVRGIGGPRSDSNLIAASRGEFVQQASAVSRYGVAAMNAINKGQAIVRYADGGMVGLAKQVSQPVPWMAAAETKYARAAENVWGEAAMRVLARAVRAALGTVWPFPNKSLSQLRRIDEGQDMQYPGTSPVNVYAILPGRRTSFGGDPGGFGNLYPGLRLDKPVYGFNTIYYGHIKPAGGGGHLNAGDVIGRTFGPTSGGDAAGLPNWLEIGFWPPSWANGPAMHSLLLHGKPGGPGSARGGNWTVGGMARLWDQAGGPPNLAHLMGAVGMAESGGRAWIRNSIGASGLWQILMPQNAGFVHGNVFNPSVNARAAVAIWAQQGLRAWEAYTNGSYRQFMARGGTIREPVVGVGLHSGSGYALGEAGTEVVSSQADLKDVAVLMRAVLAELRVIRQLSVAHPERTGRAVGAALNGGARRVALDRG